MRRIGGRFVRGPSPPPWLGTTSDNSGPALASAAADLARRKGGGVIEACAGAHRIKSLVAMPEGVWVEGAGFGNTRFIIDDTGGAVATAFQWTNRRYGGIRKCTISAPSVRASGTAINIRGGVSSVELGPTTIAASQLTIDVDMDNQFQGVLIEDFGGVGNWGAQIGTAERLAVWRNFATGTGNGITVNSPNGASHFIQNIFFAGNVGAEWASAMRLLGTGDVTIQGTSTWHTGFGMLLDNSNQFAGSAALIKIIGNEFDSTSQASGADCLKFIPGNLTSAIFVQLTDNWIAGGYNGAHFTNCGAGFDAIVSGGIIYSNANWGVLGDGTTGAGNIQVNSPSIKFKSNSSGNVSVP